MNDTACPLENQTVEDKKLGRINAYFFWLKIGGMLNKALITKQKEPLLLNCSQPRLYGKEFFSRCCEKSADRYRQRCRV